MDEMDELRRANPVSVDAVSAFANLDRTQFVDGLGGAKLAVVPASSGTAEHRHSKKVLAGALAAAAVVLGLMGFTVVDRLDDQQVIEAEVASPGRSDDGAVLVHSAGRGFDRSTDLLVVHLDYADRGDGYSAVAAREVATWFNLDPLVVAGTRASASDRLVHDYQAMMQSAWGASWIDAGDDRAAAIGASLERWMRTIDEGGHVWVAEGGVSDFTAELMLEISQQRPSLDTTASIHVVQHRDINELETQADYLTLVHANTAYERVDPGDAANDTADLTGPSGGFEEAVLAGGHEGQWAFAFDYAASEDLDFSDAVLLLHILGVDADQIADPTDFAAFFIGDQPDAQFRGDS